MPSIPLPFKPLDDEFLRIAMSAALGTQDLLRLVPNVRGVGVYALYYMPNLSPTDPLLAAYEAHCVDGCLPLYVGVSVKAELETADTSWALRNRLRTHKAKLNAGTGFNADDFRCRALQCDNRWAALVEHYLIQLHQPLWNAPVFKGFGSNVRGAGRAAQAPSQWEVVHQGITSTTSFNAASVTANALAHLAETASTPFYRLTDAP